MKTRTTTKRGFTLIELLAGMAILSILVLFLNKIFADSSTIWRQGAKRVESMTDGRAVVDYMTREISGAVVDNVLSMRLRSDADQAPGGVRGDRIYFVTMQGRPDALGERQGRQIMYRMMPMRDKSGVEYADRWRIVTYEVFQEGQGFQCYTNQNWWRDLDTLNWSQNEIRLRTLAENVRTLEFWVYRADDGTARSDFNVGDGIPAWVDVYIEMLGEEDAKRAEQLSGTAKNEFVERASRRYFSRAYLNNSMGYALNP